MRTRDDKPSLPLPGAGARARRSAVLASLLLHAALLAAVSAIRDNGPAALDESSIVRIAIFPTLTEEDGVDTLHGSDDQGDVGDSPPETPVETRTPELTAGDVDDTDAQRADPPPPSEQRLGETPGEAIVRNSGAVPTQTPAEPVEDPPVEEGADNGTSAAVVPPPRATDSSESDAVDGPEQEVVAAAEATGDDGIVETTNETTFESDPVLVSEVGSDLAREALEPIATPPVQTESMTDSESRQLTRRVERWATSFAALADWQPDTTWKDRGREYSATVERIPPNGSMGIESAIVTITTERNGDALTTHMRMQRLGFSHFAQFIDQWDPEVQIHDDVIDGRFHSNTEIFIGRRGGVQPRFTGAVTTPRGVNTSRSAQRVRRSEVFLGGLDTRATRITLPRHVALFDADSDVDTQHIHRFDTDTRIIFNSDASYTWSPIESSRRRNKPGSEPAAAPGVGRLSTAPHYFVAGEGVELYVRGTVNGQVLVFSPEQIVIEGNLVYASDPRQEPASDDYLGLVSERSVEIAEPSVTGRGDLHVHAAIYARRRFVVRNYRITDDATLFVYGSVTAGSLTATEPRFSTQLNFDARLEAARPPRFPVTDRYEITSWDRNWSVVGD